MNKELKLAKKNHKEALKNRAIYEAKRDRMLKQIIDSPIPKWGSLNIKIVF